MTDLVPVRIQSQRDRLNALAAAFLKVRESGHTAKAYRHAIDSWLTWADRNGVDPLDARPAYGQLWITELREQGYADGTRAMRLYAVRSWYEWMEEQDVEFRRNPAKLRHGRPSANPKPTPALSNQQASDLLAAADADGPRSAAIVWTLITTGLRVSELIGADIEDIDVDRGHTILRILGKGRKRRSVPIVPPTWDRLETYRKTRKDDDRLPTLVAGKQQMRRPLIVTSTGRRLTPNAVRALLRRLVVAAGVPEVVAARMSPHVTRATYITINLAAGKDVRTVQYAVGHASPVTTEGYDRSDLEPDAHPSYALMAVLSGLRPKGPQQ